MKRAINTQIFVNEQLFGHKKNKTCCWDFRFVCGETKQQKQQVGGDTGTKQTGDE